MRNIIIILDPAHGKDVKGKRSPDGVHREYKWSRERVNSLRKTLSEKGYDVYVTTESENEPGLSKRRNFASSIRKGEKKLLISLHNNASGNGSEWMRAHGVSIYTTKGITEADVCAYYIFDQFQRDFGGVVSMRKYSNEELGSDFEENFTVLMGSGYMGVLIEWLFQDNKEDVAKLLSEPMNKRFEESLVKAIEEIDNYFSK